MTDKHVTDGDGKAKAWAYCSTPGAGRLRGSRSTKTSHITRNRETNGGSGR